MQELIALTDHCIMALATHPGRVRPARFCALAVTYTTTRPVAAVLHADPDLADVLADGPGTELLTAWRDIATASELLEVWRRCDVVDTEHSVRRQAYALRTIMQVELEARPSETWVPWAAPRGGTGRLEATIDALFHHGEVGQGTIESAAAAALRVLDGWRSEALRRTRAPGPKVLTVSALASPPAPHRVVSASRSLSPVARARRR